MQVYNAEIFSRSFEYRTHQQIERPDIVEDYLSPEEFAVTMWDDSAPQKGDYIRFSSGYVGVISEVTHGQPSAKQMEVTIKSFVSLFAVEFLFDTDYQGSATSLEDFLKLTLTALFINNADTLQNIPGLSITTTSTTSDWGFHITSTEEGQHRAIINLYESIISRACEKYQVTLRPTFNFATGTIALSIGVVTGGKTIEADLPNVISKAITETTSENAVNKLIVYNSEGYSQAVTYYLHTDGTYDGTNTDRITPIVLEVKSATPDENTTFAQAAAKAASETFGQSDYRDLIEIEALADDELIQPLSLQYGQIVTVLSSGKTYTTILTGRTIADTVKLTLGVVRVDLTKKITNGVTKSVINSPEIQNIKAAVNVIGSMRAASGSITLSQTGTMETIKSLSLEAGTWLITGDAHFQSNATDGRRSVRVISDTTYSSNTVASQWYVEASTTLLLTLSQSATVDLQASCDVVLTVTGSIRAVRIK